MNTEILGHDIETDEGLNALLQDLMPPIAPPRETDVKILAHAYAAAESVPDLSLDVPGLDKSIIIDATIQSLIAPWKIVPPEKSDAKILAYATQPSVTFVKVLSHGYRMLVEKHVQMIDDIQQTFYLHQRTYAPALAASDDDVKGTMDDCVLHGDSKIEYKLAGEWSLHILTDPFDAERRFIRLYFGGDREEVYEGCNVELRQGDGSIILVGTIEYGQVETELSPGKKFAPPFNLQVQLQDVEELSLDKPD